MKTNFIIRLVIILNVSILPIATCFTNIWERICSLQPRPQEPKKRPDIIKKISIKGAAPGVMLCGELTIPTGPGPFPGIVLISGSELVDKNSKILGHKPFLILSDYLTRNGFAVFRYDDRGIGNSTGNAYYALDADFAADSAAAIKWLRNQKEVDHQRAE